VEEEFKDPVDENWNWQVRQLSASDFVVVFPSKESLRIAIHGGGLTLPSSKIKALVTVLLGDPMAAETLVESGSSSWACHHRCTMPIASC
jgi:hypothetical protein